MHVKIAQLTVTAGQILRFDAIARFRTRGDRDRTACASIEISPGRIPRRGRIDRRPSLPFAPLVNNAIFVAKGEILIMCNAT